MKKSYTIKIGNISTFDYYNNLIGVEVIDFIQSKKGTVSIETKKTKEAVISIAGISFDLMATAEFGLLLDQLKEKCTKLNYTVMVNEDV